MIVDHASSSSSSHSSTSMLSGLTPLSLIGFTYFFYNKTLKICNFQNEKLVPFNFLMLRRDLEPSWEDATSCFYLWKRTFKKNPTESPLYDELWTTKKQVILASFIYAWDSQKIFDRVSSLNRALKHRKPSDMWLFVSHQLSIRSLWLSLTAPTVNQCNQTPVFAPQCVRWTRHVESMPHWWLSIVSNQIAYHITIHLIVPVKRGCQKKSSTYITESTSICSTETWECPN